MARAWARACAVLLVVAGCWRIAATYEVFSPTADELFHLTCGMEWWETGEFTVEPKHPPLPRVAAAAGPFLAGGRRPVMGDPTEQGYAVIDQVGVRRGLVLARRGNLVFFVLMCGTVWWWTRRLGGEGAAALSVLFLVCLPPLLGHAGFATTDLALAATLPLALYATWLWWKERSLWRAALAGVTLALALTSKSSAPLFLPVGWTGMLLAGWRGGLRVPLSVRQWALASATCLLLLLCIYQFRTKSMAETGFREPAAGTMAARIYRTPLPLMQMAAGLRQVAEHAQRGHAQYFLGEYKESGWWYFFPIVFGTKTPLAFLVLILLTAVLLARRRPGDCDLLLPFAAGVCLMLAVLPSKINIGIRHILPIYPLLAVPVAVMAWKWLEPRGWRAVCVALLVAWMGAASIQAAPDYLADFNLLAPRPLERIRIDSDLDWGQDVFRLVARCRERNIRAINVVPMGLVDLEMLGLPYAYQLKPHEPSSGWFAISLTEKILRNFINQGYRWLDAYQPVERIGNGIDLYHIDNPAWPDRASQYDHPPNYGLADFPSRAPVAHIAQPLRADLLAGDLRVWNKHGFEMAGTEAFFWMGFANPGFRATLWARRALPVKMRVQAAPGPMRLDKVRHLEAIVNGKAGLQRFEGKAELTWSVDLQPGFNVIQMRTPDPPQLRRLDNGDIRDLLVYIGRIDIEPR